MGKFSIQIFCYILIIVFISHFFGDFVFQSDKISKAKSNYTQVLTIHAIIVGTSILIGLFLFVFVPMFLFGYPNMLNIFLICLLYSILNGVLHYLIDYYTSKRITKMWLEGKVHDAFVTIGFDQFLHIFFYVTIFAIIRTI